MTTLLRLRSLYSAVVLYGIIPISCAAVWAIAAPTHAQDGSSSTSEVWAIQKSGVSASLRGLSVVDARVAWASGTQGTVIRTIDGGATWESVGVTDHADLDFRDLHAWDAETCVVVNAGSPGYVFRTEDGGKTWREAYRNDAATIFFDALSFVDSQRGLALSDPQDGRFYFIESADGGKSWKPWESARCPEAHPGEAAFAASGTALAVMDENQIWLATGGEHGPEHEAAARVFYSADGGASWEVTTTPVASTQSSGIFSLAFANADHGVVVGGDYLLPERAEGTVAITDDGGKHWRLPGGDGPRGYRSAVAVLNLNFEAHFVAVGPTGTDVSSDWGNTWRPLDDGPFHAVAFTRDGSSGWAVGGEGRVAQWVGSKRLLDTNKE